MARLLVALLLLLPRVASAQVLEEPVCMPEGPGVVLDPAELSLVQLRAMRVEADLEMYLRARALPSFEVGIAILIPLGAAVGSGGLLTFALSMESPLLQAQIGVGIAVLGGLILIPGLVWLIERLVTTRTSAGWAPYVAAVRTVRALGGAQRNAERRQPPRRHRRRDPWH